MVPTFLGEVRESFLLAGFRNLRISGSVYRTSCARILLFAFEASNFQSSGPSLVLDSMKCQCPTSLQNQLFLIPLSLNWPVLPITFTIIMI